MSHFQLILGGEMCQTHAQFIAWQYLALANRLAIHKRPMTRAQVANKQHAIHCKQVTVLPTEPPIVDAHCRLRSAAQSDWKRLDNDFALRSQRITAANEAQFHSVAAIGRQSGFGRKPAIPLKCPHGLVPLMLSRRKCMSSPGHYFMSVFNPPPKIACLPTSFLLTSYGFGLLDRPGSLVLAFLVRRIICGQLPEASRPARSGHRGNALRQPFSPRAQDRFCHAASPRRARPSSRGP